MTPGYERAAARVGSGLRYRAIYGVGLTDTRLHGGCALIHQPEQLHSGSPNLSGDMRIALFFQVT